MKRALHLLLTTLCLALPFHSARAQVQDPILTLPDGQAILSISATERIEVEQDLLIGNLSYVFIDKSAREVQNKINTVMKDAVDEAKKEEALKVNTGSYRVYEYTEPRTKEKKWRGEQTLTIKSTDAESVLETTRKLQDMGLTMNGLSYALSPETSVKIQDSLMEAALAQLQTRAERAAKALGKSAAELREINVQGDTMPIHYAQKNRGMMMSAMAEADMAAPVAEAGEETISLSVSARALLKP